MTVLDENPRDGNFILSEDDEGRLSRDKIIVASGAGRLQPGTVLGLSWRRLRSRVPASECTIKPQ